MTDLAMRVSSPASPTADTGARGTGHTEHVGLSAHAFRTGLLVREVLSLV